MYLTLNKNITPSISQYFNVQFECEVYPFDCFQVEKESHTILSWVFKQNKFPKSIVAQESGQLLKVLRVGDLKIQWHISANMKSMKCLYGQSHGAQAKLVCMFYLQESTKNIIGIGNKLRQFLQRKTMVEKVACFQQTWLWSQSHINHVFHIGNQSLQSQSTVSTCACYITVTCIQHIVERLYIFISNSFWMLQNKELQQKVVDDMQRVISPIGAHGGNVELHKNKTLSCGGGGGATYLASPCI